MNFHMNVTKLNGEKIITVLVALLIIGYILFKMATEFDFSKVKGIFSSINSEISTAEVVDYLEEHSDYYYKINGEVYCVSKQELIDSNEISDKFINRMTTNYLEVEYINDGYTIKFVNECVEG